ncbi:MAG: Rieske 2Fe-2S domain-containing protein [Leptospiraceae bacterium]|nr:Rieske 2Fe-2S domain-containing protein [Leptospiraceae bacterium]MCP5495631.1 Rieske 2Fe-2S domain-containing protein [Leptospiraceae bacterium]
MGIYTRLAKIDEIEENKVKVVETKYFRIGITKYKDEFFAFEDVCSHDGGIISKGEVADCMITCPRHNATFGLKDGKPLCMPATSPIPVFNVRTLGEFIEVELEDD